MRRLRKFLIKLVSYIRREQIFKVLIIVLVVTLLGSVGFMQFEQDMSFPDALWWSIVTLTTVGYGDISPASPGGRLVGITIMIMGIGFLGILTANIASIFVENRMMESKGMKPTKAKHHFIICGWNFRGQKIIDEIRADPKSETVPVVVIADIAEKPVDDPYLHFIAGDVETDTLRMANLDQARVVIVLSDDRLDAYARDAKTILNTLAIESTNPNVYTCVELMDEKNVAHCERANADEVIVVGELSTNLLVQAALDHGITRMISELVSKRYGEDLYKVKPPSRLIDQSFYDVMCEMKDKYGILCIGIEDQSGRKFIANPDKAYRLDGDDRLIVIASRRPVIE